MSRNRGNRLPWFGVYRVSAVEQGGSECLTPVRRSSPPSLPSLKEANKLFKQAFKQRCLTVHEAQHIVHGRGVENLDENDETTLVFTGSRKSHIDVVELSIDDGTGCTTAVTAYKS